MRSIIKNIGVISFILIIQMTAFSQAHKTMMLCDKHLEAPFVSDGQEYKALLNGDEVAEFNTTFFGGSTYRVIACSGFEDGDLVFSIYDADKNLLFSNRDFLNSPYWDFEIENTVNLVIEAELNHNEDNSGFAFIQIGFKQ